MAGSVGTLLSNVEIHIRSNRQYFSSGCPEACPAPLLWLWGTQGRPITFDENGSPEIRQVRHPHQRCGTLSGDEQQMLAIARSLMAKPKLLLMEKPSLGLAPKLVNELVPIIRNINGRGVSVLLVEQNVPLALQVAKRAYALQVGKVILECDIDKFKDSEIVKRAYLGG
jgi:hypothetical protein